VDTRGAERPQIEADLDMHDELSFRFADDELNHRLIAHLKKNRIPHSVDSQGVIHYSPEDEEAVENESIVSIRRRVFPSWQVLSSPQEWADRYRQYMTEHGIPFKEELSQGELWFLLPRKYRPHMWKFDEPPTARTVVGTAARRL
jgi:hypothetical protein